MARKDVDLLHPVTEWVITPDGAVPKWHRMSPKVFVCTSEHQQDSQNIPAGAWQQNVWHTIDFRDGPHWSITGYPTEHQPNIPPYDIDKIVEVRWQGIALVNNTSAQLLERLFGAFRAPGSGLGDHSGIPESMQDTVWASAATGAATRTTCSGSAPVIDGKTEFHWWREGVGIAGWHLRLTGYTVGAEHFWARMAHFGFPAPGGGGGWDEARIANVEADVSNLKGWAGSFNE